MMTVRILLVLLCEFLAVFVARTTAADDRQNLAAGSNFRRPLDDADLRYWLTNMIGYHRFTIAEVEGATGLTPAEIDQAALRLSITPGAHPPRKAGGPLVVMPYPGGRHPRIGFLEGAIRPQRETKISVFAPWDDASFVVADVPEAIWSNLGLTYLAHTHVPTIWTKANIELAPLEWNRRADGSFDCERRLPNDIVFGTKVLPQATAVRMEMWLANGTREPLSDLRVQNCVMLRGLTGFAEQTNDNKVFKAPYAACHDKTGRRWVITGWEPCQRAWGNEKCPCLHADPKFPDCAPGKTVRLRGWLSFYEGSDIDAELARIDAMGWRQEDIH